MPDDFGALDEIITRRFRNAGGGGAGGVHGGAGGGSGQDGAMMIVTFGGGGGGGSVSVGASTRGAYVPEPVVAEEPQVQLPVPKTLWEHLEDED